MRYWWVNHKKTFSEEIDGGFLWSPQVESNGARSQFYENMKSAEQGDFVLSYASGSISYIGKVAAPAVSASRPEVFGKKGEAWSKVGWLLPVSWSPLTPPIVPKDQLQKISNLLPEKYSPIQATTGNGNQKAYLCEISKDLFRALTHLDTIEFAPVTSLDAFSTDALTTVVSRRGQQKFKEQLLVGEGGCRITGITEPWLLIASHIKPWRHCANDAERLDPENGLLFPPHIDHLFDRGLTTIFENRVVLASQLGQSIVSKLGLSGIEGLDLGEFSSVQLAYIDYHNRFVFKGR